VIDDVANSVDSTRIRAWVLTFLIETSLVKRTVRVQNALGVVARCCAIHLSAPSIWTTWRGIAGIYNISYWCFAFHEWITHHVVGTSTYRIMIDGMAFGSEAANVTMAWIDTLVVDARLVFRTIRVDGTFGSATLTVGVA
jgi:hypothetical protein